MSNIVTIDFRGDTLFGVQEGDAVLVGLKPMVEAMGLDWSSQLKRIKRDPVLSEGMVVMTIPSGRGGVQDAVCLRLDLVNGWLFTIQSDRIKDDRVRAKVIAYQRECYRILSDHFLGAAKDFEVASISDDETTRLRLVTESRRTFGRSAAAQLWFRLGLPVVPAMMQHGAQLDPFPAGRLWPHQ